MARARSGEGEAQAAILDYLALRGWFVIRLNNQPISDPARKLFRKLPKHMPKGLADILALKPRRTVFIEVKGKTGKVSKEQHDLGADVIIAGADYVVARGIDDVQRSGL